MGNCSYCSLEKKLTREHIIPDWYGNINKNPDGSTFVEKAPKKLVGSDPKIKDVCSDCNNVILSRLDNYARGLYEDFFKNPVYDGESKKLQVDKPKLTRWLMKVAYNSARANNADLHVLKDYASDIIEDNDISEVIIFCSVIAPSVTLDDGYEMATRKQSADSIRPVSFKVGVFRLAEGDWYKWSFRYVVVDSYAFYMAIPQKKENLSEERKEIIKAMLKGSRFGVRFNSGVLETKPPKYHAVEVYLGHVANFPVAYGVVENPLLSVMAQQKMDRLHYAIDREDIENKNFSNVVEFIDSHFQNRETLLASIEKVEFSIIGYDEDPRELWEIEDVRSFLAELDGKRPYWLFFQPPESAWVQVLFICICEIELVHGGFQLVNPERDIKKITDKWFSALNEISHKFAISYELNRKLSERLAEKIREMQKFGEANQ